jgi:hypothetical protein
VRDYLEAALARGAEKDWDLGSLRRAIESGALDLYAFVKGGRVFGAGVSSEIVYPKRKVLEIVLMSCAPGHEEDWRRVFEQFKARARGSGFSAITGTGRPGWARKLGVNERRVFEVDL